MDLLFLLVAFIAEVIGTIAGFGSSTIALPLALYLFDYKTALVLVAFLHIFGNIARVGFFRFGIDKHMLVWFGIPSIVFTVIGAMLVSVAPQDVLRAILGAFLMIFAVISWPNRYQLPRVTTTAVTGGILSGFFAGLIGTGGALRGAFLTAFALPKERYIATAAALALAVDVTRLPIYLQQGFLPASLIGTLPALLAVALLGSFLGKRIVSVIPQSVFRRVVLVALFFIGVQFVYGWIA